MEQVIINKNDRVVVVIEAGWIVGGNRTVDPVTGRITLRDAVHVLKWTHGGFALLCKDPLAAGASLRPCDLPFEIPARAEIFSVPVAESWGR